MAFTFINKLKKVGALFEDLECGSDGSLSLSAYLPLPMDPGDPGLHPIFALPPLCDLRLVPPAWPQVPHPFLVLTLLHGL